MRSAVALALMVSVGGGCSTDSHKVTITFAGDGAGWVDTGEMRCTSSCTIENAPSAVHLLPGTTESFGGWSSSCDNAMLGSVANTECALVIRRTSR